MPTPDTVHASSSSPNVTRMRRRARHVTLRDRLAAWRARAVHKPCEADLKDDAAPASDYWALRDISVEVAAGEIFGLAGHNGSGKSTLLKVVARDHRALGRSGPGARSRRRAAGDRHRLSHGADRPREHLSQRSDPRHAAGRDQAQLRRHRRYVGHRAFSRHAGQTLFAAACTCGWPSPWPRTSRAEILLLDEVLAVGDEAFQQTCRNKILELAQAGRAIVVVSHDTNLLRRLCGRVMLLESGRIQAIGKARDVLVAPAAA